MEKLPNEIIEHICKYPSLSIVDVVNFSSTCSTHREIVTQSSSLWKAKYFQSWPETDIEIVVSNWYDECIRRKNYEKQVSKILSEMSEKFYNTDIINISNSQLGFAFDFMNSQKYGYHYMRDYLIAINSLPLSQSLTNKYYSSMLLNFINKKHYTQVWNNLISSPLKYHILEKGAIFATYWGRENGSKISNAVTTDLDYTADLAKHLLLQREKDHPLRHVQEETFHIWRNENIPDNMFKPVHCKSILAAISFVLFETLKYCILSESTISEKKKLGIYYAVADRRATPLVFAIIYESVSRRLGVKVDILQFANHCLLKWKESYKLENTPYHYISMSNRDLFLKTGTCPHRYSRDVVTTPCNMIEIAERSAYISYEAETNGNFLNKRDALELLLVINPFYFELHFEYCRCHMLHEMDVRDLISKLVDLRNQVSEYEWNFFRPILYSLKSYQKNWNKEHRTSNNVSVIRRRVDGVEFAVGMIVRDKLYDKVGVIYGWEEARKGSQWNGMVVSQPMYKIACENGHLMHSLQENLQILHAPPFVSNPIIGRFFEEHCTTYYKPNKELRSEYPEDWEALLKILKKDREV